LVWQPGIKSCPRGGEEGTHDPPVPALSYFIFGILCQIFPFKILAIVLIVLENNLIKEK